MASRTLDWHYSQLLKKPFIEGSFAPDYSRCIAGVLPTALRAIGAPAPFEFSPLPYPNLPRGRYDRLFFFFLDSLGLDLCLHAKGLFAKLFKTQGLALTSVYPSITSAALCSIYTGRKPAEHGVLGHKIWMDEAGGIVDMLKMQEPGAAESLPEMGVAVRRWLKAPPLLAGARIGLPVINVIPESIKGSGISNMIYPADNRTEGYGIFVEGLAKLVDLLEQGPCAINFYNHWIDESSHKFTPVSPQSVFQLKQIEDGIAWLAKMLSPKTRRRTLFALVSDHGQNAYLRKHVLKFEYNEIQKLKTRFGLQAVGTSGRLAHVYCKNYPNPDLYAHLIRKTGRLGVVLDRETSWWLSGGATAGTVPGARHDAASDAGGGASLKNHAKRLGDYTILLHPGTRLKVEFLPPEQSWSPDGIWYNAANHGSLTPEELIVPSLLGPLPGV